MEQVKTPTQACFLDTSHVQFARGYERTIDASEDELRNCEYCRGTGRDPNSALLTGYKPCPVCSGWGSVPIGDLSGKKKEQRSDSSKKENSNEKDTADRLFDSLITHPRIKQASQNQFKSEMYRPAVLDAMISLEVMIKEKAKYPTDDKGKELSGVSLMHKVFDSRSPILSWCKYSRQIDKDELEGYKHIFAGAMQGIRDPKAHAIFQISPMRAFKITSFNNVAG